MKPRSCARHVTILDPVYVANLAVYLVQLPPGRTVAREQPAVPSPVEFISLESARAIGEVVISETGMVERVRLANHSDRDLFIQAGEVLRGGDQDRAVAGDLIVPAPRHEPESCMVPVFCAEPERSVPMRGWTPDLFMLFDQTCPGQRLKKELRLGTQEDVWREITAMRDVVFDIVNRDGTRATPPYSLWTLIEMLEAQSFLTPYIELLLPLAEANLEATGALFVLGGRFNNAELYATPALFRQMWPKLLYAMAVEALVEQKQTSESWTGNLPTKGEVTAWLAAGHRRESVSHTDKIRPHGKLGYHSPARFAALQRQITPASLARAGQNHPPQLHTNQPQD